MCRKLTIDIGNTLQKIAVFDGDEIIDSRRVESVDVSLIDSLSERHKIGSAIFSSVNNCVGEQIEKLLNSYNFKVHKVTATMPLPFAIDYRSKSTLGSDRIAAAAAAFELFPNKDVLVVDLGTAATYDVLTSSRHFVGGNIAPGLRMRLHALHAYTDKLPAVNPQGEMPAWGTTTETAIRLGAVDGIVGEIEHYYNRMPATSVLLISGGDAEIINNRLSIDHKIIHNLVHIGLNSILKYNENK